MAEVGRAYLTVMPDAKGFGRNLNRQIDGPFTAAGRQGGKHLSAGVQDGGQKGFATAGGSLGKVFVGAFAAIGAARIVGAVTDFLSDAVSAASDLAETQAKAGEIFGGGTDAIIAKSKEAAAALGQSQQTFLDGASTFGIFGQAAGLAGDDLVGFSTEMVTLATDLASFNNTSPEEAIQAIGAALRGESEPIRAYGVLLDDATLKQQAMTLGIYDGEGALTAQQRTLAAQAEILAQTSTQQGDFARTSEGLANQQRILEAQLADVKTEIGTALLPAMTELFRMFASEGVPILKDLAAWFTENKGTVTTLAFGVVEGGILIVETLLGIMAMGSRLMDFWVTMSQGIINTWFNVAENVINAAVNMFGWVPGVGDKLRGVQAGFAQLRTRADAEFSRVRAAADETTRGFDRAKSSVTDLRNRVSSLRDKTIRLTVYEEVRRSGGGVVDGYYVTPTGTRRRATGGPVRAGVPYLVGEQGPELMVPSRSGVIVPNHQVGAGGGGFPSEVTLVDADGSILARTRVVAAGVTQSALSATGARARYAGRV